MRGQILSDYRESRMTPPCSPCGCAPPLLEEVGVVAVSNASSHGDDQDRLARRNARLLSLALALGGANSTINFALGGILGSELAPSRELTTLPITAFVLGSLSTTIPASLLMARIGRKPGFLLGGVIGMTGGLVGAAGVVAANFWLFCLGTFLAGSYLSWTQFFRFAAADNASPALRPKVISWVLAGGLVAAFLGPQIVINAKDLIPGLPYVGPFFGSTLVILASMAAVALTRWPKSGEGGAKEAPSRPLAEIARSPRFITAVAIGMLAYASMNLVMTAAPVAMVVQCGYTVTDSTLGIQWHVLAMYAPSFITGSLISRYGKVPVMLAGLAAFSLCGVIGYAGLTVTHFWLALVFLGIGWNFAYVGATALVADCHTPAERGKVQGLNDFLVFGLVSVASLTSGVLQNYGGWHAVLSALVPAVILALAALGFLAVSRRRPARA